MEVVPERSWVAIEEKIKVTADDRHRAMLERYRDHMQLEMSSQLEPLMATMVPEPVFNMYLPGATQHYEGHEEVAAFYGAMFAAGTNRIERQLDRLVVCDEMIWSEGWVHQVHPGANLADRGYSVEPGKDYVFSYRAGVVFGFPPESTLIVGEDAYFTDDTANPVLERLQAL